MNPAKEGIMFTALYIKKCIKEQAQDELQYFRMYPTERDESGRTMLLPFAFKEGDYFNCPERMKEDEAKVVKEYSRPHVYTSEPKESFLTEECFWIPTENQLREGLINVGFSIGDSSNMNEEQILDLIMRERKEMRWSREKENWVKIK